ncbi:MAG: hypothetical protein P4L40_27085 [Terracidiphilus sp.]|nr:hypothetical protein [Terracidiphilus sp.]
MCPQVLIMGSKDVLRVAKSYGFKRPLLTDDIAFDEPTRCVSVCLG